MFNISEERINKARANNYFCEKVTDELPIKLLQELKSLSKETVIKVPIRHKGITSGQPLRCYWNANVISQTFGGMPVYGWLISHSIKDGIRTAGVSKGKDFFDGKGGDVWAVIGHGCWLTPEGKLVDVTAPNTGEDSDKKFRYFLPSNKLLKLNGRDQEVLKSFEFATSEIGVKKLLEDNTGRVLKGIVCGSLQHRGDHTNLMKAMKVDTTEDALFQDSIDFSQYVNKIIAPYGFPQFVWSENRLSFEKVFPKDNIRKVLSPHFGLASELSSVTSKGISRNGSLNQFLKEASNLNKNLFELHHDVDWEFIFLQSDGINDGRKISEGMEESSVCGISTTNGKTIYEIPPKSEVIESHSLPRNKKRKRKIIKIAQKSQLTAEEILTLNNEFLFPHPYLCRKNSDEPIAI